MRCVLVGNYGARNVGDEALKDYFLARYPEVTWTVLSAHPVSGEYPRLPAGIRSFFSLRWLRTLRMFRSQDAMVFGGGSLFTDIESPRACFIWWVHAMLARLMGLKIVYAFQGVGPFVTRRGKRFAVSALNMADFLSVRDAEAATRCDELVKNIKCVRTSDPVFLSIQKSVSNSSQNVLIVIPRHNSDQSFQKRFAELSKQGSWDDIRIVSLQLDDPQEQETIRRLQVVGGKSATVVEARTLQELVDEASRGSLVLTQRYHGAIAALCVGRPVEIHAQSPGDKLWVLRKAVETNAETETDRLRTSALEGENALKAWFAAQA